MTESRRPAEFRPRSVPDVSWDMDTMVFPRLGSGSGFQIRETPYLTRLHPLVGYRTKPSGSRNGSCLCYASDGLERLMRADGQPGRQASGCAPLG